MKGRRQGSIPGRCPEHSSGQVTTWITTKMTIPITTNAATAIIASIPNACFSR